LAQFVSAIDRPTAGYEAGRTDWYEAGYNKGYDEGFQMGLEAKTPPEPEPPPAKSES
jgi:flagellar biosynthesis/type III secretory pathway protein FliH